MTDMMRDLLMESIRSSRILPCRKDPELLEAVLISVVGSMNTDFHQKEDQKERDQPERSATGRSLSKRTQRKKRSNIETENSI